MDVFIGVQPHIGHHACQVDVLAGAPLWHGHGLPLQVTDRPHALRPKQLETADMDARQHDNGIARVHADNERGGEAQAEVGVARGEGLREAGSFHGLDVLDLGEPLALQEVFGHVLGGNTDPGDLDQPKRRRLGWWLRGDWPGVQAEQPRRACHGQPTEEASPRPTFSLWGPHGDLLSLTASVRNGM
jgi:hypothetical protein